MRQVGHVERLGHHSLSDDEMHALGYLHTDLASKRRVAVNLEAEHFADGVSEDRLKECIACTATHSTPSWLLK